MPPAPPPHPFGRATPDTPEVRAFLATANPAALAAMEARSAALAEAGLWQSRSNSLAMGIA